MQHFLGCLVGCFFGLGFVLFVVGLWCENFFLHKNVGFACCGCGLCGCGLVVESPYLVLSILILNSVGHKQIENYSAASWVIFLMNSLIFSC